MGIKTECPICNLACDDLEEHLDSHSEAEIALLLIRLKAYVHLATKEESPNSDQQDVPTERSGQCHRQ